MAEINIESEVTSVVTPEVNEKVEEVKADITAETIEKTPEEDTVVTDSTEEVPPAASEEVQKDEVTEAPVEEVEEIEEIDNDAVEEVEVIEDGVDEFDASDLPANYGDEENHRPEGNEEENPEADPNAPEADPLTEIDGDWYLSITIGYGKRAFVENRLRESGIQFIVTATGEVLVGPYATEADALKDRKPLLTKGLKGTVKSF